MERVALIDADILVYRCAAALKKSEYRAYTEDGELLYHGRLKKELTEAIKDVPNVNVEILDVYDDVRFACRQIDNYIDTICETTGSTKYLLFVTGPTNFRNIVATIAPYKGHRPERPRYYQEVKDYLWSLPGVIVSADCEADDYIGVWSQFTPNCVICSIDKDLDMLPGQHYHFVNKEEYYISQQDGLVNFYRQILTGDVVDNIVGIRGIGNGKAAKLITHDMTEVEMYDVCLREYKKWYEKQGKENSAEAAILHVQENGQLLWLWRAPGDVWSPPAPHVRGMEMTSDSSNQSQGETTIS